jgi:tight adherence protein C
MNWMMFQRVCLQLLWALFAGGIGWYILRVASEITYATLADGRQQIRRVPLLFRMHLPLAPNLFRLLRRPIFNRAREQFDRRLTAAGYSGVLSADEMLALKGLMLVCSGAFWFLFVRASAAAAPGSVVDRSELLLTVLGCLWLFVYPDLWLKRTLQARHRSIQRALPFVLDLLTLSVEAGLDFMTAMQRNIQRRAVDPLNEELILLVREIQLGKTRAQALRDLGKRVDLSDLKSVVYALVQADELGVSIGSILRIQSDQMRQRRFERAEKLANEAPVKMLFPLMVFIFPSVFLILLGPIINRLIQEGL